MQRQTQGSAIRDAQIDIHTGSLNFSQLFRQWLRADHHARAKHGQTVRIEYAAWQLVQLEGTEAVYHRVTGVVTTLETDTGRRLICQIINNPTFTLITPVSTYYNNRRHNQFSLKAMRLSYGGLVN
ncbi:Uncharacterised protein [Plesiomonas shigelloides]|nr:Uncharacterised protein [Plesiomonas shigelloides]